MESPNLVKVVAAFVAGVVIALGSALIYVRVSEMVHPQAVAVAQGPMDALPSPAVQPPAPTDPEPPPDPIAAPTRPAQKAAAKAVTHRQPKIAMAQLAQKRVPVAQPVTYASLKVDSSAKVDAPAPSEPEPLSDPVPAVQAPTPEAPPAPEPHTVTLQTGTALPIRLSETLSSDHNYTGDTFRGTLEAPIISDGFIIADRGSKVLGRVVTSERAGLSVTLTEINTTDGQRIPVQTTSYEQRGPSSMGQDAATIAGGVALGAIIGAAAGGGKGAAIGAGVGGAAGTGAVFVTRARPAALPVETRITFRLATPLTLTEKLN